MSIRIEGIVLRKKVLRENDLLLNVFTLSDGRIKLVQKQGLKKPKAGLDLFCRNEFIVSENKDFALIYQISGLDLYANIRRHYILLQEAANAVKTIEKITSDLQPNPELYILFSKFLQILNQSTPNKTELKQLRLNWYTDILHNEGLYDGQPVTEKSFQLAIVNYRG